MKNNLPIVLLIDDEVDLCMLIQMSLKRLGIRSEVAHTISQAKLKLKKQSYDACITDIHLPDGSGLELVHHVVQNYDHLPIAVLTAHGNMDLAIDALKAGAFDFINKPIDTDALKKLLNKVIQYQNLQTDGQNDSFDASQTLIGTSPVIQKLRSDLKKMAQTQAPVFITGESGTGKEVAARLIHQHSPRKDSPFVAINCGAIPSELMESEFFGYAKGSFTGAHQNKVGLILAADGGTLFLDEIAELPLNMQVKLLRAVQEKKIRPLGTDTEIPVDFRIISATHQNLEQLVHQGRFRQDLFFRLHVMDIYLPPLRERGEDIMLLAEHFIAEICQEWQETKKELTTDAKAWLNQQPYHGNIRELRNVLEKAITLCDGVAIDLIHLPIQTKVIAAPQSSFEPQQVSYKAASAPIDVLQANLLEDGLEAYLESIEKSILIDTLNQTYWNRTQAAKKLNMSFRSLRYRLKKFGLDDAKEY